MPKLAIDIEAKYASAMDALDSLGRKADQQARFMKTAFAGVGGVLAGALSGVSLAALNQVADSIANFKDLADQMGDTAEAVGGLKLASDLSGVSLDEVSAASVRLTSNLAKGATASKGTAEALKAINIGFDEMRELSPVAQLERVAAELAKFEDGASKTAVAVELFGRAGANLIPFLNDLADAGGRTVTLTQEQIEAADLYSQEIARLQSQMGALTQSIVADLLPAFNDLISGFNKLRDSGAGVFDSIVGSLFPELAQENLRQGIDFWLKERDRLLKGLEDPPFIFRNDQEWAVRQRKLLEDANKEVAKLMKQRDQLLGTSDNQKLPDMDDPLAGTRARLKFTRTEDSKGKTPKESEAEKLTKWLEQQVQQAQKLNLLEQTAIKIAEGREKANHGITPELEKQWLALARQTVEAEKAKEETKERAEFEAFLSKVLTEEARRVTDLADSYRDLIDPAEQYRKKLREITDLQESGDLNSVEAGMAREKILDQMAGLDDQKEKVEELDEFTRQAARNMQDHFADYLFDPFEDGLDGLLEKFSETVRRMVAEAVSAQLMNALLGDFGKTGQIGGIVGGLMGGGTGSSTNTTDTTLRALEGGSNATYGAAVPAVKEAVAVTVNVNGGNAPQMSPAEYERLSRNAVRTALADANRRNGAI